MYRVEHTDKEVIYGPGGRENANVRFHYSQDTVHFKLMHCLFLEFSILVFRVHGLQVTGTTERETVGDGAGTVWV